jgi:hypothetical protein
MPKRTHESPTTLALITLPRDRALVTPPALTSASFPRSLNSPRVTTLRCDRKEKHTANRPLAFSFPLTSDRVHPLTGDGQPALQYFPDRRKPIDLYA